MEAASVRGLALWQISEAEQALAERLAAADGVLTPELEAEFDALEGTFEAKAERIALYVRELQANAAAALEESERVRAIHDAYAARAKRLKEYLQHHMERSGRQRVETPRVRVWVQPNGGFPSIRWAGSEELPARFSRVRIELDSDAVRKAYTDGALPEGFVVEPRGRHVRIA